MYIASAPILDCIRGHRRLYTVTTQARWWPDLRHFLHERGADYLAVHYRVQGIGHVIVIGSAAVGEWDTTARAIDQAEALRLGRLWLNLRRPAEVVVSASWSARREARHA